MTLYIQYAEDGTIVATVRGTKAPEHPRQLSLDDATPWDGMRVDLDTKTLISCPIIAKDRHNQAIFGKLRAIDDATIRALRDLHLKNDKKPLQDLEDRAVALRSQILS